MKAKLLLYITALLLLGSGCTENETFVYSTRPSVYFNGQEELNFSFAGHAGDTATLKFPVLLLGQKLDEEKKYAIRINDEATTAEEGLHYKALENTQVFPAGRFSTQLIIELYQKDTRLQDSCFYLDLTLIDGEEMDAAYPERLHVRIGITNQLLKPSYWDSFLKLYYSEYSRVKHNQCIVIQGHDFPASEQAARNAPYGPAYWMVMGRAACAYFMNHPTLDENDNLITVWQPF